MTKTELIKDMKQSQKGASFITVTALAGYLGRSDKTKVKNIYLRDLEKIGNTYFIPDVAEEILKRRSWNE